DLVDAFADGVWWIDLAPLSDASLVPQAAAKALGMPETRNGSLSHALGAYLRAKRLLLVWDNCEHLIAACAALIEELLNSCHHLKILATSRERLNLNGEVVWHVPSLQLPTANSQLRIPAPPEAGALRARQGHTPNSQLSTPDFQTIEDPTLQCESVRLFVE